MSEKLPPPARVRVWFRIIALELGLGAILLGGNFPRTEYNMSNIFVEKSYTKLGGETIPRPYSKKSKLSLSLGLKASYRLFLLC